MALSVNRAGQPIHVTWHILLAWEGRMADRWGSGVFDRTNTAVYWRWLDALCKAVWGADWMTNEEWLDQRDDKPVNDKLLRRMLDWEKGDWPEWAWTLKRQPKGKAQGS